MQGDIKEFIEQENEDKFLEWESKIKLTEKLKDKIVRLLNIDNIYDIMKMTKEERGKCLKK